MVVSERPPNQEEVARLQYGSLPASRVPRQHNLNVGWSSYQVHMPYLQRVIRNRVLPMQHDRSRWSERNREVARRYDVLGVFLCPNAEGSYQRGVAFNCAEPAIAAGCAGER